MEVLWEKPSTITEITEQLYLSTKWKENTVIVLLRRMLKNGTVSVHQEKNVKFFSPCISQEEAQADQFRTLIKERFQGDFSSFASALVKVEELSKDQIDNILKLFPNKKDEKE